jgi:8-oxo-dGTP pyrophosphatase MutT (NUDIX family)
MKTIVGCIIINNQGDFLLQKKTFDYPEGAGIWTLFGGEAKSLNLEEEMLRELEEEMGFKPKVKFLFEEEATNEKFSKKLHVFLTKINDASKISLGEGAGFAFFNLKELDTLNLSFDTKKVIDNFLEIKNKS